MGKDSDRIVFTPPSGLQIHYRGPDLGSGPLPALFYFALSGEDSLYLDPFNQPVVFLENREIRVFSSSLPAHGPGLKNTEAMRRWGEELARGNDILGEFLERCGENLDYLVRQELVDEKKVAAAGLSRGGFIATHFAARNPAISHVLGFAPLTTFETIQEIQPILNRPLVQSFALEPQMPRLIGKRIRYYIGNLDTRVGTQNCFDFIYQLSQMAYQNNIRSPEMELIISPSIGHKGHGTPPHIFKSGADWLYTNLI